MKSVRYLFLAAILVLGYAVAAAAAPYDCTQKVESFDFVVDYSGSMMMKYAPMKNDKVLIAKDLMQKINDKIPNWNINGGLHTITPNGALVNQGPWNRAEMSRAIGKLRSDFQIFGRMTAMGDGFKKYEPFLSGMKRSAAVILFSDGDNNSGSDFVNEIRGIYATQRDLVIHIVSFADTKNGKANLDTVAKMNPNTVYVKAEDLNNDAAIEKFVAEVFCGEDDVLVLRGVNFAFNSYALDSKAQATLNEAASIIKNNPNKRVVLTGWTDWIGSDAYNQKLSQNRANSVKDYLVKRGVPASRMHAIGCGKSFKYDNKTEEGRYLNRRTDGGFE